MAALVTLYLTVSFSLLPCTVELTFTSAKESEARLFSIFAFFSGEVDTIRAGQFAPKVEQKTVVILSVVSTFKSLSSVQLTAVLAFCLIFTITSK